uniref:Restorer of fertility-like protein n=1 Tax=Triticum timopheevii TaxID=4570 RepID=A0A7S5S055_TRITI|nr:restorer of fertility-like protein [Triticum timopheevii]
MTRLYSTTACARRVRIRCCCRLSSTTSPPSRTWSPRAAFAVATEHVRAGTLSRPDAHRLFGELLRRDTPVPSRSLNGLLPVLARSTSSAYVPRHRWARPRRRPLQPHAPSGSRPACGASRSVHLLMDCCCRARRPDLGLAFLGRLLRTGLKTDQVVANNFLKCLCYAKRTDEDVDVLLHRMPDLGCVPNAVSCNIQ